MKGLLHKVAIWNSYKSSPSLVIQNLFWFVILSFWFLFTLAKYYQLKITFPRREKGVAHTLCCRTSLVGYFYEDLSNFSRRIEGVLSTLFWALFGHADKSTFDTNKNAEITEITGHLLFATYSLASVLVAMNLLIAMLSNTFKKVSVSISNLWVLLKY